MQTAGTLQALGIDGLRWLATTDTVERLAMVAIGREATKQLRKRDEGLAVEIANAVGRMLKK